MNKKIVILVPVIAVAAAVLLTTIFVLPSLRGPAPTSIEAYVRLNINALASIPAPEGEQYSVTSFQAENGTGVVSYGDEEQSYTADFSYVDEGKSTMHVTSFDLRQ